MGLVDTLLRRPRPDEVGVQVAIPVTEIPSSEPVEPPYPDTITDIRKRILEQIHLSDIPQIRQELLKAYPAILAVHQNIYRRFMALAEHRHQPFTGRIEGYHEFGSQDGDWSKEEWLIVEDNQLVYHSQTEIGSAFIGAQQSSLEITGGRWGENITSVNLQSSESRVIAEDGGRIPRYGEFFNPARQFGEINTFELKFTPDGTPLELAVTSASGTKKEAPDTNLDFKLQFSSPQEPAD